MKLKIIMGMVLLVLVMLDGNSQPIFYSQSLQKLYYSLPAVCRVNNPAADTVSYCSEIDASIVFNWDEFDMLAHFGYRFLHDDELRQAFNPAVVRFLEREILALLVTDNLHQKLEMNRDNRLLISLNGNTPQTGFYRNPSGLPHLMKNVTGMNVSYLDGRRYKVDIICGTDQTLTFDFVADPELLSDMDKKERDDRIAAQLSHYRARVNAPQHECSCSDAMMQVHNDSAFVCRGGTFIIPQLNGNLYYTKSDGELRLAFGKNWLVETLSNAMLEPVKHNYTMQITQRVYGGKKHNYQVDSHDFFDYFSDEYERFFGIEKVDRDILYGTLVLASKNVSAIHLVFVSVSVWDLLNGGTMNIQLDANIPQHNIETLFGKKREQRGEHQFFIKR